MIVFINELEIVITNTGNTAGNGFGDSKDGLGSGDGHSIYIDGDNYGSSYLGNEYGDGLGYGYNHNKVTLL